MIQRAFIAVAFLMLAPLLAGCEGPGIDATYGRARGESVNGTGALVRLFRDRGDEVRITLRLNAQVGDWAQTIVRFAPYPGLPERKESEWLQGWLAEGHERRLIYVPFDYNAESEYWARVLKNLPADADSSMRDRVTQRRDNTKTWASELPTRARDPARTIDWFGLDPAVIRPPTVCKTLSGPWAEGIDPAAVALTRHEKLIPNDDAEVLLDGDGEPLVFTLPGPESDEPQVLVVANGSFLLNLPLVERSRRPLAARVVDWAGPSPRRVAFVESRRPASEGGQEGPPSMFALLQIEPFGWIAAHMAVFGLLACLAAAARVGRAPPEPPAGSDRPAAHAEALGDLLARTRDAEAARQQLDAYRRWRHVGGGPAGGGSASQRRGPIG